MFRTIFVIGAFALAALFVLKLAFGLLGPLVGLLLWLGSLALKIALVGLVVYGVIRVVSPATAHRLRERWGGSAVR